MLERPAKDKRYSLFVPFASYEEKGFLNIDTWVQCYEPFYSRNLQTFVMSKSVCAP
jgi:hypothetical protein